MKLPCLLRIPSSFFFNSSIVLLSMNYHNLLGTLLINIIVVSNLLPLQIMLWWIILHVKPCWYFGLFSVWKLFTKWIVFRGGWTGWRLRFESMQWDNFRVCGTLHFMKHLTLPPFCRYVKTWGYLTWRTGDLEGHNRHL